MLINVADRSYWVEDTGKGPVWIWLHGFTGSPRTFDACLKHMDSDFRFIKVELPGHGKRGRATPVSMETFCKDLHMILKKLNIQRVNLIGYSLGGRAALSFALLYPSKVDRLVLESTSPGLATATERNERIQKDQRLADFLRLRGLRAFVEYWESLPLFSNLMELSRDQKERLSQERLSHTPEGLASSLIGMGTGAQPSWWSELEGLDAKVLLITGEQDEKFCIINKRMAKLLPNAGWKQLRGAGHTVHLEQPRLFAKIVEEFMIQ